MPWVKYFWKVETDFRLLKSIVDIPNLTKDNIHYGLFSFANTVDLQAISKFSFKQEDNSIDADGLKQYIQNNAHSDIENLCSIY